MTVFISLIRKFLEKFHLENLILCLLSFRQYTHLRKGLVEEVDIVIYFCGDILSDSGDVLHIIPLQSTAAAAAGNFWRRCRMQYDKLLEASGARQSTFDPNDHRFNIAVRDFTGQWRL